MIQKLKCKLGHHRLVKRFEIRDDGMSTLIRILCASCHYQDWPAPGWGIDTGTHSAKEYIDIPLN